MHQKHPFTFGQNDTNWIASALHAARESVGVMVTAVDVEVFTVAVMSLWACLLLCRWSVYWVPGSTRRMIRGTWAS